MDDPAMDAARLAWNVRYGDDLPSCDDGFYASNEVGGVARLAVDSAREALAPLRELHRLVECDERGLYRCQECNWVWPCETAEMIYPEDEL